SGSASVASSNSRKVQNLIERCLQLYMNRGEVVRTLSSRARIEPGFTTLVQLIYLWGIQFFRSTQCQLHFSLMLTPWVVDSPAVMWSMVFLLQAVFIPFA
ncbi:hypothetical protein BHM03_00054852, partial [Ensete ventricosum]